MSGGVWSPRRPSPAQLWEAELLIDRLIDAVRNEPDLSAVSDV